MKQFEIYVYKESISEPNRANNQCTSNNKKNKQITFDNWNKFTWKELNIQKTPKECTVSETRTSEFQRQYWKTKNQHQMNTHRSEQCHRTEIRRDEFRDFSRRLRNCEPHFFQARDGTSPLRWLFHTTLKVNSSNTTTETRVSYYKSRRFIINFFVGRQRWSGSCDQMMLRRKWWMFFGSFMDK